MNHMKNEKGLTLIELLAVIVILAIISAIAIPAIGGIINNSEIKATKSDALNILNAANIYVTDNPSVTKIEVTAGGVATSTPEMTDSFINSVQSVGSFKGIAYTIEKDPAGKLSITTATTTPIDAGGKKITFAGAGIADINAKTAEPDAKVTFAK